MEKKILIMSHMEVVVMRKWNNRTTNRVRRTHRQKTLIQKRTFYSIDSPLEETKDNEKDIPSNVKIITRGLSDQT